MTGEISVTILDTVSMTTESVRVQHASKDVTSAEAVKIIVQVPFVDANLDCPSVFIVFQTCVEAVYSTIKVGSDYEEDYLS